MTALRMRRGCPTASQHQYCVMSSPPYLYNLWWPMQHWATVRHNCSLICKRVSCGRFKKVIFRTAQPLSSPRIPWPTLHPNYNPLVLKHITGKYSSRYGLILDLAAWGSSPPTEWQRMASIWPPILHPLSFYSGYVTDHFSCISVSETLVPRPAVPRNLPNTCLSALASFTECG